MKMSDALRAAAESAPVADVHVSTGAAARRVRRNRALRAGANGLVGVGAAALVFAGVAGVVADQTSVAAGADAARDGAEGLADMPAEAAIEPGFAGGSDSGACGTNGGFQQYDVGNVTAAATIDGIDGSTLQFTLTYATTADGSFTVGAPTAYVLWGDSVVATGGVASDAQQLTVSATEGATLGAGFELTNCWDGAELPAGDYQLITVTPLSADVAPVAEPTGEPGTEPDPDTAVSRDASDAEPIAYAVSEAVAFTIPGDQVKDPFGEYLNPVTPTEPAAPSDALTPDDALAAYEAAAKAGAWDMAKGSQRVVLTSSGEWESSYYGCPSDGLTSSFPTTSAELDWLGVDVTLPSRIHVDYGWVVDGNPEVTTTVTNRTQWSVPGFYAGGSVSLYLVKDGTVVAQAYPVPTNVNGMYGLAAEAGVDRMIALPGTDGYLAPGESVSGTFLWRDVYGCWSGNGQAPVKAGTYTVLTVHDLFLGGGEVYAVDDTAELLEGGSADGLGLDSGTSSAVAPAPDQGQYASFQVWTSLGTVTVID